MENINYFYVKDEDGNLVLDADNKPVFKTRPIDMRPLISLEKAIKDGRPQKGIDATAKKVADGMNWSHYDSYITELVTYETALANYQIQLDNYNTVLAVDPQSPMTQPEQPTEPTLAEFELATIETVMAMVADTLNAKQREKDKLAAFTYKDVVCSVCESDQNGWFALSDWIRDDLADGHEFEPFPFNMENGNSVLITSLEEWNEFKALGKQNRKAFFVN